MVISEQHARLFIGIALLSEIVGEIQQAIEPLQALPVHWLPKSNWHVTVLFIGDQSVDLIPLLQQTIFSCATACSQFSLTLCRWTIRQDPNQGMFWLEFEEQPAFGHCVAQLQQALATKPWHIPIEQRQAIPHLTLARWRNQVVWNHVLLPSLPNFVLPVKQVCLYQSVRDQTGSRYHILQQFNLHS